MLHECVHALITCMWAQMCNGVCIHECMCLQRPKCTHQISTRFLGIWTAVLTLTVWVTSALTTVLFPQSPIMHFARSHVSWIVWRIHTDCFALLANWFPWGNWFCSLYGSLHLNRERLICFTQISRRRGDLRVVLICIALMTKVVEHFFRCFLAILYSSVEYSFF